MRRRRGSGIPASDLLAVVASERTPGATAYEGLARRPSSKQSKLRSTAQLPKSPVHKENDSKHITSRVPRLRARRGRRPADGGALRSLCGRLDNVPVAPAKRRAAEEAPLLDRGAAVARAPPQPADLLRSRRREEVAATRRGARGRERRIVRAVGARGVGCHRRRRARVVAVRRLRGCPAPSVVRRVAGPEGRGDDLDLELLRHGLLPAAQFGVVEGGLLLGGGVAHVPPLGSPPEGQDAAMTGLVVAFAESSKSKNARIWHVALGQPQRARAAQNTDTAPLTYATRTAARGVCFAVIVGLRRGT